MSQITTFGTGGGGGGTVITITGNTGGPVGPDGFGNINIVGTGNITVAGNAGINTEFISITGVIPIIHGGTNASSFATVDGTVYYDGTRLVTTATGTSGQILTSNGAGVAPSYQNAAASSISITGDSGGALTGNSFTFTGGTTGLTFSGAVTTETLTGTLVVSNGGTGRATLTNHGILVGAGTSAITQLGNATNGQLPIGSTGADPVLATLTAGTGISITNGAGTISISASGTTTLTYVSVNHAASPYTVLSTDDYIGADVTAGVITILLPNAPSTGRVFIVKDKVGLASTSNITITTVGGVVTIDGSTSFVMNTAYESVSVLFNGTSYEVF